MNTRPWIARCAGLACAAAWLVPVLAQEEPDFSVDAPATAPPVPSVRPKVEPGAAQIDGDEVLVRPFARVRYDEQGLRVVRRDGAEQDLGFNSPVYDGDRVETLAGQRAEIQLPDGSLVRIDSRSAVEFYELAAYGEDRATLLGLGSGTLQADVPDPRGGNGFRVDTPAASIYPMEAASFRVDVETGDSVRVSVESGRVEVAGAENTIVVRGGERTRVVPGGRGRTPWTYNVLVQDGFDVWVGRRDDVYRLRAQPGREYDELPAEVKPYYGELSRYGSWVYVDDVGWTWKPTEVDEDWRPYWDGHWDDGPWGPVWVGVEPWGWPVYRYGRWNWSVGWGWTWAPGPAFAPAHVYWYYGPSYVGWAPLDYWNLPVYISVGVGFYWGDPWFNGCPWAFVPYHHFYGHPVPGVHVPRRAVLPRDLHDGVVGRRAVVAPAPGARGGDRKGIRPASEETFKRARDGAQRREALERVADVRPGQRTENPKGRRSFLEQERQLVERRRSAPRDGDRAVSAPRGGGSGAQPPAARTNPGRGSVRPAPSPRTDVPGRGGSGRAATPRGDQKREVIRIRPGEPASRTADEIRTVGGEAPRRTDPPDLRREPVRRIPTYDRRGSAKGAPATEPREAPRRESPARRSDASRERERAVPSTGAPQRGSDQGDDGVRRLFGRIAEEDLPVLGNDPDRAARTAQTERTDTPRGFVRRPPENDGASRRDVGSARPTEGRETPRPRPEQPREAPRPQPERPRGAPEARPEKPREAPAAAPARPSEAPRAEPQRAAPPSKQGASAPATHSGSRPGSSGSGRPGSSGGGRPGSSGGGHRSSTRR